MSLDPLDADFKVLAALVERLSELPTEDRIHFLWSTAALHASGTWTSVDVSAWCCGFTRAAKGLPPIPPCPPLNLIQESHAAGHQWFLDHPEVVQRLYAAVKAEASP